MLLVGPTTGSVFVDAAEPWSEDGHPLVQAGKGLTISLKVPEPVRRNDVVYVLEPRT